jgi:hypothetical protein
MMIAPVASPGSAVRLRAMSSQTFLSSLHMPAIDIASQVERTHLSMSGVFVQWGVGFFADIDCGLVSTNSTVSRTAASPNFVLQAATS